MAYLLLRPLCSHWHFPAFALGFGYHRYQNCREGTRVLFIFRVFWLAFIYIYSPKRGPSSAISLFACSALCANNGLGAAFSMEGWKATGEMADADTDSTKEHANVWHQPSSERAGLGQGLLPSHLPEPSQRAQPPTPQLTAGPQAPCLLSRMPQKERKRGGGKRAAQTGQQNPAQSSAQGHGGARGRRRSPPPPNCRPTAARARPSRLTLRQAGGRASGRARRAPPRPVRRVGGAGPAAGCCCCCSCPAPRPLPPRRVTGASSPGAAAAAAAASSAAAAAAAAASPGLRGRPVPGRPRRPLPAGFRGRPRRVAPAPLSERPPGPGHGGLRRDLRGGGGRGAGAGGAAPQVFPRPGGGARLRPCHRVRAAPGPARPGRAAEARAAGRGRLRAGPGGGGGGGRWRRAGGCNLGRVGEVDGGEHRAGTASPLFPRGRARGLSSAPPGSWEPPGTRKRP